jgi:alpha-glucoside transport system substrate-binding protein
MFRIKYFVAVIILAMLAAACAPAATSTPAATQAPATSMPAATATEAAPTSMAEATATEAMATSMPEATATEASTSGQMRTPQEAALAAAGGEKIGGSVSVLAVWGGSEQESFMAMIQPFEDATGIQVNYTGTRDLNAVLTTQVQGGNPPDVAGLPGPGQMAQYARAGNLVDLSNVLDMNTYNSQYAKTWSDLGTVDGQLVGIFIKASVKGLIWYDPQVWDANNYQIPATWDDMMTLSSDIASTGATPWCVALESGAASGWPGTDWLEDIVLRQSGEQTYNDWWQGNIAWTSPEIKQAFETWGKIVADPSMVYGGANNMLTTNFANVGDGLFTTPPNCYLVHQASFIADMFQQNNPGVQPGTDFNFFPFPPFDTSAPKSTEIAGDLFGMFNDTPQAEALIRYLTSPEAQAIWVQRGGAISPNKDVPLSDYPDALSQAAANRLVTTDIAVFDASDLMPEAMNSAFWQAILDYVQTPGNLDSILQNLDSVQKDAYSQS